MRDLTEQTPVEIDTALAELYMAEMALDQAVDAAVQGLHHVLRERKQYFGRDRRGTWPTTTEQARHLVEAMIARHSNHNDAYCSGCPIKALARYTAAVDALAANEVEQAPLHAEYARRPWTRFFLCQANGGHIHSSMRCKTCHRGRSRTEFGWNVELSGLTEAEAVARLGQYASSLCTVCYPSAPVEWTDGRIRAAAAAVGRCAGSDQKPDPAGQRRRSYGGFFATCTGCGDMRQVTSYGVIRKHKPSKVSK